MKWISRARPLLLLGLIVLMVLGISNAALADEPAVQETEAPAGEEVIDEGGVIVRDSEQPPAVDPDGATEPGVEEPMVISPAPAGGDLPIVNPEGTIGIDESVIAPAPGEVTGGGWGADEWLAMGTTALVALLIGSGATYLATRRHYLRSGALSH